MRRKGGRPVYKTAIAFAVSLTLFTGSLAAQQSGIAAEPMHKGETLEALQSWSAEEIIERYDVDDDGELGDGELAVFGAAAAAGESARMDQKDRGEQMLKLLDKEGSGTVDQEELQESELLKGKN